MFADSTVSNKSLTRSFARSQAPRWFAPQEAKPVLVED